MRHSFIGPEVGIDLIGPQVGIDTRRMSMRHSFIGPEVGIDLIGPQVGIDTRRMSMRHIGPTFSTSRKLALRDLSLGCGKQRIFK